MYDTKSFWFCIIKMLRMIIFCSWFAVDVSKLKMLHSIAYRLFILRSFLFRFYKQCLFFHNICFIPFFVFFDLLKYIANIDLTLCKKEIQVSIVVVVLRWKFRTMPMLKVRHYSYSRWTGNYEWYDNNIKTLKTWENKKYS